MRNIVILGGGFAGVWAARAAAALLREHDASRGEFAIQLVSRTPWLTIRPRLYEPSLEDTRVALNDAVDPTAVEILQAEVTSVDLKARVIRAMDGARVLVIPFDRLIVATGSRALRPPVAGAEHAFSVDTYAEAKRLQAHLNGLAALSGQGARAVHAARHTAVVVGAGFTGIEVATTLIARMRRIAPPGEPRVILLDRGPAVAGDLGPQARSHVERALAALRIETRTNVTVAALSPSGVTLTSGEHIGAATVVWTGGLRADEIVAQLGPTLDNTGRVEVDRFLGLPSANGIYVAGDAARAVADVHDGIEHIAPMSCQCAIPMGDVAGHNAAADLLGLPRRQFAHPGYVTCLDLGEAGALFMSGWDRDVQLTGFWGGLMKQTINTRLIYPTPVAGSAHRRVAPAA